VERDKQYRFDHSGECTTDQNRRTFARRNVSGLSAFSLERASTLNCPIPPYIQQRVINYANWSSGYRSGTAMHVNVRKDICFPSACIRFDSTQRSYECTRVPNTYVRTIYTRCLRSVEKYARASEHVHDKYHATVTYVRLHLKEILPDVLMILFNPQLLPLYLDFKGNSKHKII